MSHRKDGEPYSDYLNISSGNADIHTALSLRDEESFEVEWIKIEYNAGGSNTATLEVYDEPDGTSAGNLNDKLDQWDLQAGDRIIESGVVLKEIEDDILVTTGGNQDDAISVTIGGHRVSG